MSKISQLPTLYSRTSTGAVQEWTIYTDQDSYWTVSGQVDGKKTTSKKSACEAKNVGRANETTAEQQAELEAQAKWDKKKKTGYSDVIGDIDTCQAFVAPMLAHPLKKYIDKIDWRRGVFDQNKYNGVRCVATFDGERVWLKSREGEIWLNVQHINQDLLKFFQEYPEAVLDGELYNYDLRQKLNELSKLVRKTVNITDEDRRKSEEMVRYYIYDGYNFGKGFDKMTTATAYDLRKPWIDANLPKYSKHFRAVKTWKVHSMGEVDKLYQSFLEDLEEGAIIRICNTGYENKRSKYLLKHKPVDTDEAVILDIQPGTGNYAHRAKMSRVRWQSKEFNVTWMGDEEQCIYILQRPEEYIGKKVTFKYNGLTGLGVPNYGRIDPDNCFSADR